MGMSVVDRFHFLARTEQREKTPILAQAPDPKVADGVATLRLYDVIDSGAALRGLCEGVRRRPRRAAGQTRPRSTCTSTRPAVRSGTAWRF
jgi:hypothetical protein